MYLCAFILFKLRDAFYRGVMVMLLFRIEGNEDWGENKRDYNLPPIPIQAQELDSYIAEEIKKEVNGSKQRKLLSYSKSLGICLLKYVDYCIDKELHILYWLYDCSYIQFGNNQMDYDLEEVMEQRTFDTNETIEISNFIIDISDNEMLDQYLRQMTGTGKKKFASPQKDQEVVVMNPDNDWMISFEGYLNTVYLLYALVYKYGINETISSAIKKKICDLEPNRFIFCEQERNALIIIVDYLSKNYDYEKTVTKEILDECRNSNQIHPFDSIVQFLQIQEDSFDESYMLSDYNPNIVSEYIWNIYYWWICGSNL